MFSGFKPTFFKAIEHNSEVLVKHKKPMFGIKSQNYKSILTILFIEDKGEIKRHSFSIINKEIFNNVIFKNTQFNYYKNPKPYRIDAKNISLSINIANRISAGDYKNIKVKHLGVKYTGMKYHSSYLGNTVGIPIISTNKILQPLIKEEEEIAKFFTHKARNVYSGYTVIDIIQLMKKYSCRVFYDGRNEKTYYRFYNIIDYIQDDYYKDILEKIVQKKNNSRYDHIFFDNEGHVGICEASDVTRYMNEIMNIILGKDITEFKKHQDISRKVSKTTQISGLSNKISDLKMIPFEHQTYSISWLYELYVRKIPGAILADDVGMGKSLSAIGFITALYKDKRSDFNTSNNAGVLIICPASMVSEWHKEIAKANPKILKMFTIYSFEKFQGVKLQKDPTIMIIDEAQKAKNKNTINNKRLSSVNAKFTLLLTGTPIENRISDIYNILFLVDPIFSKIYNMLRRISRDENVLAAQTKGIIDGIYMRRMKTKEQLPVSLQIEEVHIQMTTQEEETQKFIKEFYGNSLVKLSATDNIQYYNEAMIAIGRLRQCVSYSYQLKDIVDSSRLANYKKLADNMKEESSKTIKLLKLIKDVKKNKPNDKFIVFVDYTKTLKFIKGKLESEGYNPLVIDGSVSSANRGKVITQFQDDDKHDVIIVSLKAGNAGITLTQANHVVLYDLWWNPAILTQAMGRAYRIGQAQDVKAYLFINDKSIDESITRIINLKKEILDAFENTNTKDNSTKNNIEKIINDMF